MAMAIMILFSREVFQTAIGNPPASAGAGISFRPPCAKASDNGLICSVSRMNVESAGKVAI